MTPALLADVQNDPLALIISGLVGAVVFLLGIVQAHSSYKQKQGDKNTSEIQNQVNQLWRDVIEIKGDMKAAKEAITGLKTQSLTREIFEIKMGEQNNKLDNLESKTKEVDDKVTSIDRGLLMGAGRSYSTPEMPAVRPPTPGSYRKPGGE